MIFAVTTPIHGNSCGSTSVFFSDRLVTLKVASIETIGHWLVKRETEVGDSPRMSWGSTPMLGNEKRCSNSHSDIGALDSTGKPSLGLILIRKLHESLVVSTGKREWRECLTPHP